MWQTTGKHPWFPHGMPLPIGHMLTPPTGKANSIRPTEGATWQFLFGKDYTGSDMGGVQYLLNFLILWNLCDIANYPKGRLVERLTLLNSSIQVTIQLGHSSSSQYWHNLRSKDRLKGCSKTVSAGDWTTDPRFERSFIFALTRDRTVDPSG